MEREIQYACTYCNDACMCELFDAGDGMYVCLRGRKKDARRCSRQVSTGSRLESRANYPLLRFPSRTSLPLSSKFLLFDRLLAYLPTYLPTYLLALSSSFSSSPSSSSSSSVSSSTLTTPPSSSFVILFFPDAK